MRFAKYHALGNDYIVLNSAEDAAPPSPAQIRQICDRHYGLGSDGILWGPLPAEGADFGVRIFNPDGSEAEKSGNGLRIFSRYLWDQRHVRSAPFTVRTAGGRVVCQVHRGAQSISVEMGQACFDSHLIPVSGPRREVLNERMLVAGQELLYCAVSVGNPHCVIRRRQVSQAEACRLGPLIENEPRFPNRTNVQFMQILGRDRIRIEIWERGAGYTLASGSSSCAAAATAYKLGLCEPQVEVLMPGGSLQIQLEPDFTVTQTGPVTRIARGFLDAG